MSRVLGFDLWIEKADNPKKLSDAISLRSVHWQIYLDEALAQTVTTLS